MAVLIRAICLTFGLGLVACGTPTPEDICARLAEECSYNNDTCVDDLTDLETAARGAGCDAEADEYLSCLDDADTSFCEEAGGVVFCVREYSDLSSCVSNAQGEG